MSTSGGEAKPEGQPKSNSHESKRNKFPTFEQLGGAVLVALITAGSLLLPEHIQKQKALTEAWHDQAMVHTANQHPNNVTVATNLIDLSNLDPDNLFQPKEGDIVITLSATPGAKDKLTFKKRVELDGPKMIISPGEGFNVVENPDVQINSPYEAFFGNANIPSQPTPTLPFQGGGPGTK